MMRAIFAAHGRLAVYAPPGGGVAVPCRAIRATRPLRVAGIEVPVEGACFDLLRADVTPVVGGTLTVAGVTHAIDVPPLPFPVDQDPEGTRWRLLCGWGSPVVLRSVTGSGATQNPPTGGGWRVAADAPAGASSIDVTATLAAGQLRPGDTLTVGGVAHAIMATVQAVSNRFAAVPVSPALAAPVTAGDPVSFAFGRDVAVRAAVIGYAAEQLQGGVQVGDRRLVIPAAGLTDEPRAGDRVTLGGRPNVPVVSATAACQAGAPVLWDLVVRG